MITCDACGSPLTLERVAAKGYTQRSDNIMCCQCADRLSPVVHARMLFGHKTGGEVVVAVGKENARKLEREYKRSR